MHVNDLDTPALVIDLDRVEANVSEMAVRARDAGVRLRPHTKTHKMVEMARLQLEAGASGLTCATLGEAEVMADAGAQDILIAFPLVGPEKLSRLRVLRERARVLVSLDSLEVAQGLGSLAGATGEPVEVYVEVDTGLHRLGRAPGAPSVELVQRVAEVAGVRVIGLLSHAGHAYRFADPIAREQVIARQIDDLVATRRACAEVGIVIEEISVGSTPTVRDELLRLGVNEVRPGTYIFNDTNMIDLGVATQDTCAARILATVISRPSPTRFVLDAGTKSLAADGAGRPGWVQVVGRDDLTMEFLSEEHGVGVIEPSSTTPLKIGDKVLIIPRHVCTAVNLFDVATGVRGELVDGPILVAGRAR